MLRFRIGKLVRIAQTFDGILNRIPTLDKTRRLATCKDRRQMSIFDCSKLDKKNDNI
jgi:hypothetical protein